MQDDRFDRLARFLARGRTRRRFVTLMAGAALAAVAPATSDAQDVCLVLNADCQFHGTPCCPPTECISDVFTGLGTCQTPTTATAQSAAPPTVSPAPAGASAGMWGGDPARTGVQPGPAPTGKPALAWSFATGGESAPPVVAEDRKSTRLNSSH